MKQDLIIIGGGGHAKVLIDILTLSNIVNVVGVVDTNRALIGKSLLGIPIIGDEDTIFNYSPNYVQLVNGLGSVNIPEKRRDIFNKFKKFGFIFYKVIHPSAIISRHAFIGEGAQIMAGAVIQAGAKVDSNTIINTKASVDHDCEIGSNVHIAPGVTISGSVFVGDCAHVGTGANVIQGVRIGCGVVIGAGALVLSNLPDLVKAIGVPAKVFPANP